MTLSMMYWKGIVKKWTVCGCECFVLVTRPIELHLIAEQDVVASRQSTYAKVDSCGSVLDSSLYLT
jgi:hypothetical protein